MRALLFYILLAVSAAQAEQRLLLTVAPNTPFKADEALFFVTDDRETVITRSIAVRGGTIDGDIARFAAIYRGDAEKITYKLIVVGEQGELLAIGPVDLLTSEMRRFEEADSLNPRIAELRAELEVRRSELTEIQAAFDKQLAERDKDPIVNKISSTAAHLATLKAQTASLQAELVGRQLLSTTSSQDTPRGFQTRLSTLTSEIQALAVLASQAERAEKARQSAAQAKLVEVRALVDATKGESLPALTAELTKLQKMQPR